MSFAYGKLGQHKNLLTKFFRPISSIGGNFLNFSIPGNQIPSCSAVPGHDRTRKEEFSVAERQKNAG